MGYELRRWLADRLPDGISSGERLVALEIADQAHEKTRLAYGRDLLDIVIRRTGLSDAKQVGKILAKLGANGIELRVPIAGKNGKPVTDKLGRVLYACKGHELTLRIPRANECPALKVPQAGELQRSPEQGTTAPKAPPAGAQRSPARGTKLPQAGDPTSQESSDSSSLASEASVTPIEREIDPLVQKLMDDHGATEDEATTIVAQVRGEGRINSLASWASSNTGRLDIKQRLYALRHSHDTPAMPGRSLPPWCGECGDGDPEAATDPARRFHNYDDGSSKRCDCHPASQKAA